MWYMNIQDVTKRLHTDTQKLVDSSSREWADMSWQKGKTQLRDRVKMSDAQIDLIDKLTSESFLEGLSNLTGIRNLRADPELHGGGFHFMPRGSRLDVHVDFSKHKTQELYRRLNLIVFLNETWHGTWGGQLELWDEGVRKCNARIVPTFGQGVLFETTSTSWHGVTTVQCPDGYVRQTLALYYYTAEKPAGWVDIPTTFRARPGEKWREKLLWPAERFVSRVKAKLRR